MRIRVPGIVDIESVSSAKDVELLLDHPSLDRGFIKDGPLINRIILGRILSTFHVDHETLPGFRSRSDGDRQNEQKALRKQLDKLSKSGKFDEELLKPAIEYVAGRGDVDEAMEAICQLFASVFHSEFSADAETQLWRDAKVIQASLSLISLKGMIYRLLRRQVWARKSILKAVDHAPNGLHAIAITTANIEETLKKMRELATEGVVNRAVNPDTKSGFWALVRTAPENIMRRVNSTMSLPTSGSILTSKSLIRLSARRAQKSEPVLGYEFAEKAWSACPASTYVPALCWFIWQKATDGKAGKS